MKESAIVAEQMTPAGKSRSRVKAWFRSWLSSDKRTNRGKSAAAAAGALREPEEMQRCPYLHEMKERLLSQPTPTDSLDMERLDGNGGTPVKHHNANSDYPAHANPGVIPEPPEMPPDSLIGTVVKLNSDGYGSHTSPAHARQPLVPQNSNNQPLCLTPTHSVPTNSNLPKNAKVPRPAVTTGKKKKEQAEMVGGGDCKVATVEVEASAASDNTATLPVTRPLNPQAGAGTPPNAQDNAEKNNAANKEMELKNVRSTPAKKTSLFIIMSFIYAKLLVVVCIAYVISEVVTYKLPLYYYEGFFTYLYGVSILFLLYVFCFLLQESACCSRGADTPPPPPKPPKQPKDSKDKSKKKDKKDKKDKDAKNKKEFQDATDVEAGVATRALRKRKTSQNDSSHGSFFLRIGAIAFGLGTMVYNGLEFGVFFEVPPTSLCYHILQGVNPVLQMIFTFMQMYFIFMNSRLNIHRFKVIARFGLMHVVATNICVWIRTLVLECIKEIATHHRQFGKPGNLGVTGSIHEHTLRHESAILGESPREMDNLRMSVPSYGNKYARTAPTAASAMNRAFRSTVRPVARAVTLGTTSTTTGLSSSTGWPISSTSWPSSTTTTTTAAAITTQASTSSSTAPSTLSTLLTSLLPTKQDLLTSPVVTSTAAAASTGLPTVTYGNDEIFGFDLQSDSKSNNIARMMDVANSTASNLTGGAAAAVSMGSPLWNPSFNAYAERLTALQADLLGNNSCGRVNIMGTIVKDAAPYLYPFIIEYSLIGAAVIYVMWKHIGRHPRWPHQAEADLERRLEAMLSRRAVALANADESAENAENAENVESGKVDKQEEVKVEKEAKVVKGHGRMDCVGASKGLFFGLLLLVGSLICLILYFVLIHHPDLGRLAIYLADVSHCAVMALSILAIIIGFCRVQNLKFKAEEQSDLNDILLRISAFGLFIYATFCVISGAMSSFDKESNLLIMVTGLLAVFQVVLQLLFIADISRRRVHLPEHDRSKPGRQIVTFLLICNVTMWVIYTFEGQKVTANPMQITFYGFIPWTIVQRITVPLCIFHRFHSAVTLAEIWKTSYKARLE